MLEKLLKLKAEAEHELLYAQAKLEVVEKLLVDDKPTDFEEVVGETVEFNSSDDEELAEV